MAGTKGRHWHRRDKPCAICRHWFIPDPRTRQTQRTCSRVCSRELHRRNAAAVRRRDDDDERAERLRRRL